MTILIVDDDPDDIEVFSDALGEIDVQLNLQSCSSAEEAMAYLESTSDLPIHAFIDINMPILTGIDLLRIVRGKSRFDNLPITILSTSKNQNERWQDVKADFIQKPSTFREFVQILSEKLANR